MAIEDAIHRAPYDEIVISTLPRRLSRWLHLDLVSKARGTGLPVTHVEAQRAGGRRDGVGCRAAMRLATFLSTGLRSSRAPARCAASGRRVRRRLDRARPARRAATARRPTARDWPLADVTLLAPVPQPRAIFGIGLNYAAHAAETGRELPERRSSS